jgi:selenide,water dikinase
MAVIGEAHPDRLLTNAGARPGDCLVLTKPLGTGILTTALKRDELGAADLAEAVAVMTALNDGAARAALATGAHAATDITGFGLLGHLGNLLSASGVGARLRASAIPVLPGARELAARGVIPGGSRRNREAADGTTWGEGVGEVDQVIMTDAQTSGGLLLCVAPERLQELLALLHEAHTPAAAVIGECTATAGQLLVEA